MKVAMNARPTDAWRKILDAHDLHIAPLQEDRETYGRSRPLCSLRLNGRKEGEA